MKQEEGERKRMEKGLREKDVCKGGRRVGGQRDRAHRENVHG